MLAGTYVCMYLSKQTKPHSPVSLHNDLGVCNPFQKADSFLSTTL